MLHNRIQSDFSGDRVNCIAQSSMVELFTSDDEKIYTDDDSPIILTSGLEDRVRLLACVTDPQTMAEHFIDHGWDSPGEQIADGYRRYIEPTELDATYDEIFDFGPLEIATAKVTVSFVHRRIEGEVQVRVGMAVFPSTDYVYGARQVLENFTKVRLHLHFIGANTKSLIDISELVMSIEGELA